MLTIGTPTAVHLLLQDVIVFHVMLLFICRTKDVPDEEGTHARLEHRAKSNAIVTFTIHSSSLKNSLEEKLRFRKFLQFLLQVQNCAYAIL